VNEAPHPAVVWNGEGDPMTTNAMESTMQGQYNAPMVVPENVERITS